MAAAWAWVEGRRRHGRRVPHGHSELRQRQGLLEDPQQQRQQQEQLFIVVVVIVIVRWWIRLAAAQLQVLHGVSIPSPGGVQKVIRF